jgi:hypothetical protein
MAPSLDDLGNQSRSGIIQSGGLPLEEQLYQRQAQSERQGLFDRGLGASTVTRDALAKARVDAAMAAQQAQLSALGQAAAVTQQNLTRAQQERQFSRTLEQNKKASSQQALSRGIEQGVGALGSLAGSTFGPEIRTGVRGVFGKGPLPIDDPNRGGNANAVSGGAMPTSAPMTIPQFDAGGGGLDLSHLGDYSLPTASFGSSDFPSTDFGDFGGLELGSLYDASFSPYWWDGTL